MPRPLGPAVQDVVSTGAAEAVLKKKAQASGRKYNCANAISSFVRNSSRERRQRSSRGVFEAGAEPTGGARETTEAILRLAEKVCGIYNVHDSVPVLPSLLVRTLLEAE